MSEFTGEVHPYAEVWPPLDEEGLASLVESIAANGLREPLVVDRRGRLVDGRNRQEACRIAGVAPRYVTPAELDGDESVAAFVADRNAERRHLTAGQQAMGRALMLQAQGKRRNGRWERGIFANNQNLDRSGEVALSKAGLVLDVAARAAALGPDFADYTGLPTAVMARTVTLDFAYRMAQDFDGKAALAEAMKTQPLDEAILTAGAIFDDLDRLLPLPQIDVPLTAKHRRDMKDLERRARAVAAMFKQRMEDVG